MKQPRAMPDWVVLHLPHDSLAIPEGVRGQFVTGEAALANELLKMTDRFTGNLFGARYSLEQTVRAPVSRLVVDVERFDKDELEPMSARGMGAIYLRTHDGAVLRNPVSEAQRRSLMESYYFPHHQALVCAIERALVGHGRALVVDAHSFPCNPLPYEINQKGDRPEICIGTDEFHTPAALLFHLQGAFEAAGFTVATNEPFSGALVPQRYYQRDARVSSVMIEVRRDIYMDECSGEKHDGFEAIRHRINGAMEAGVAGWFLG